MDGNEGLLDFLRRDDSGARIGRYWDGQTLFKPTDQAINFFVVETGEVRLFDVATDTTRRLLDILGTGRCFGFASMGKVPVYEKLAISMGNSTARIVPAARLREILVRHPGISMTLIESMARQVHRAWTEGSQFVFENCNLRLVNVLVRYSNSPAARPVSGRKVELRMTHQQLAQAVGVARETVTYLLAELRQQNMVQTRRNRVTYDPHGLRQAYSNSNPTIESAIAA
jgi:CRP/FNR family transcriptional regulator